MQIAPVEVFRSPSREACDERVFMLSAVNIASDIVPSVAGFSVFVAHPQGALAAHHLWQYEQELRRRYIAALPAPPLPQHPHAWRGSLLYVALLVVVALAVVNGWGRHDLFTLGVWIRADDSGNVAGVPRDLESGHREYVYISWEGPWRYGLARSCGTAVVIVVAAGFSNFVEVGSARLASSRWCGEQVCGLGCRRACVATRSHVAPMGTKMGNPVRRFVARTAGHGAAVS